MCPACGQLRDPIDAEYVVTITMLSAGTIETV